MLTPSSPGGQKNLGMDSAGALPGLQCENLAAGFAPAAAVPVTSILRFLSFWWQDVQDKRLCKIDLMTILGQPLCRIKLELV